MGGGGKDLTSIINKTLGKNSLTSLSPNELRSKYRKRRVSNSRLEEFKTALRQAVVEKDIENAYRSLLSDAFSHDEDKLLGQCYVWTSPYQCDGFFSNNALNIIRLLMECKLDENYLDKRMQCSTLLQALYYIRKFKDNGEELPNIVFIADRNECFIVHGSALYKYLDEKLNWALPPSSASSDPSSDEVLVKMVDDSGIMPYVYKVADESLNRLFEDILRLASEGGGDRIRLDRHNFRKAFDRFLRCLIDNNKNLLLSSGKKISMIRANALKQSSEELDKELEHCMLEIFHIFMASLIYPGETYPHPKKKDRLMVPSLQKDADGNYIPHAYNINVDEWKSFWLRYETVYSQDELREFTEIGDSIIEDSTRRYRGDFWTPAVWAEAGADYIARIAGPNWRDEFVVWDCCCGTKNLTRDLSFKHLYCSTLHRQELMVADRYNKDACSFQYDFLNDDPELSPYSNPAHLKMPAKLFEDLKAGRDFVFFINPPFATANEMGAKGEHKASVAKTGINDQMLKDGMGKASQQLLCQFFYRIIKIKRDFNLGRVILGSFFKPVFLTPSAYFAEFRDLLFKNFGYEKGFLFPAGDFSSVSVKWGVAFGVFDSTAGDPTYNDAQSHSWRFDVMTFDKKTGNAKSYEECPNKIFRCWPEKESCSCWIREPVEKLPAISGDYPQLSSALNISSAKGKPSGVLKVGALGYMVNVANNIYNSARDVWIVSSAAYKGHGVSICPENFERCLVNFAVRNVSAGYLSDFIHDKDEFHVPDENHPLYRKLAADSAAYTFFANAGNQASINITWHEAEYALANHLFFFTPDIIKQFAGRSAQGSNAVYEDCIARSSEVPHMVSYIQRLEAENAITKEFKEIYVLALKVLDETMPQRNSSEKPLCLNRFDAGWKQLSQLAVSDLLLADIKKARNNLESEIFRLAQEVGMIFTV